MIGSTLSSKLTIINTTGSVPHFGMQTHEWIVNKDERRLVDCSVSHFRMDKSIINKDERIIDHGRLRSISLVPHFRMQIHEQIVNKDEWISRLWIIKNFRFAPLFSK
ncbi:hypothetical protein C1645_742873 [Glomus cerebriforme]|uniref:Uncharacterized protein n=1 Tax=Glomus cerebriforme TaxID=658196 RepID=A0A397SBM7_9GLOM|nr:hypothetical protein C1645_742873 [Glomus cerebriforme]